MPPGGGAHQLLAGNLLPGKKGGPHDLVGGGRLSGLTLGIEAPSERASVPGDCERVVGAGRRVDDVGQAGNRVRMRGDARSGARVADDLLLGEGFGAVAEGLVLDAAPGQALAGLVDRDAVVFAAVDLDEAGAFEDALDAGRVGDDGVVFARVGCDPQLAEVVGAPAVHGAGSLDREGVVHAGADVDDARGQGALVGKKGVDVVRAGGVAASELALFVAAPGVD